MRISDWSSACALPISGVALLIARLSDLQIVEHEHYQTRADENRMRVTPVAPVRGLIYDRNGTLLAQNQPAFVLEVTPEPVGTREEIGRASCRESVGQYV